MGVDEYAGWGAKVGVWPKSGCCLGGEIACCRYSQHSCQQGRTRSTHLGNLNVRELALELLDLVVPVTFTSVARWGGVLKSSNEKLPEVLSGGADGGTEMSPEPSSEISGKAEAARSKSMSAVA